MSRARVARVCLKPSLVVREESDHYAILYDPDTGGCYAINPVSVVVCRALEGGRPVEEAVSEIRSHFADAPETVDEDVKAFVDSLVRRGLASVGRPKTAPRRRAK